MTPPHHHRAGGKRLRHTARPPGKPGARLAALLLCLAMLAGALPLLASAEDGGSAEEKFSNIVAFDSITLHYAGADGQPAGEEVQNTALLGKNDQLILRYTYAITEDQCSNIQAGTKYYLDVSPHLILPHLENGSPLTVEAGEETPVKFGDIHADGTDAWVTFDAKQDESGNPDESGDTVLSDYGELNNAYFYLNCGRAAAVPDGEAPIEGKQNLYAMKFENGEQLSFGYAEHQPVTAKAQISKGGSLTDKTVTWTIDYTPWQNPAPTDHVTLDTPFELRDTIDTSLHSYVEGSVTIDGSPVAEAAYYTSRGSIPPGAETYVLVETTDNGGTALTFGGTNFNAGEATQGNPAAPLTITYRTAINDELLLPGGPGGKRVTNAADLFAGENGVFNSLNISSSTTVNIPQPSWLTKTGKTTRHTDGTGSTTDWTVIVNDINYRT